MGTFKLASIIFVGSLLVFAGCADEQARLISTTCEALKRYFTLSKNDYNKCLSDEDYRRSLLLDRDEQWSRHDKNTDGTDKNILVFYVDIDNEPKHRVVIATDAFDNDQKIFISRHCWLNTADYSTSMCYGDVFVSVQREPMGHFITY